MEEVNWLWYPCIPLGKLTVIQGDPAQGKTHLLLKLAADCTNGTPFTKCEANEPFNVIYQTAEDEQPVTVFDERVEQASIQTQAKLVML